VSLIVHIRAGTRTVFRKASAMERRFDDMQIGQGERLSKGLAFKADAQLISNQAVGAVAGEEVRSVCALTDTQLLQTLAQNALGLGLVEKHQIREGAGERSEVEVQDAVTGRIKVAGI
jgi:hypothetical protein